MLMESGAAAPGLAFSSDVDTGLFRSGSNELAIATNGVKRVEFSATSAIFNNAQNDYDFRIEGTTKTNLFRADPDDTMTELSIGTGTQLARCLNSKMMHHISRLEILHHSHRWRSRKSHNI